MPDLRKSAALVAVPGVLLVAFVFYFLVGSPGRQSLVITPAPKIHYAGDEKVSLSSIRIKVFYFIPRDLEKLLDASWEDELKNALDNISKFYQFQLHGAVSIDYNIYPEPVLGEEKHSFYDSDDTNFGNPHALVSVRSELDRRVFDKSGDLYSESFLTSNEGEYEVMAILYEGVGSSAIAPGITETHSGPLPVSEFEGTSAFIVSRAFLSSSSYKDYGLTIFAHEFGHTLGLSDAYDLETANPTSDDIMGAGRFKPLTSTYLSKEDKKRLGINY